MPQWVEQYREPAGRLIAEATATDFAWQRLAVLTDRFGHRLSGSEALEQAIRWAVAEMKRDGLENVHTEPVMVPKWVRGRESATMVEPGPHAIVMLGLGDSIGTPPEGVQAEVLVVSSFADLEARAALAKGRIVLFNVPFVSYGDTRTYRTAGPSRAARHGAVAALVRAVGPLGCAPRTPVACNTPDAPRIPAASVTGEDAERMQRLVDRGERVVVRLQMEARFEGEVESANVVGELRGRERPDEVVVVAGHLDSWDVGTGASDDGGGCVATWEALRIMKKLGLRPRRTVRVVLFTNEENGGRGGLAYRDRHRAELPKHVMMLESDIGVFRPTGLGLTGSDQARAHRSPGLPRCFAACAQISSARWAAARTSIRARARGNSGPVARGGRRLFHGSPYAGGHHRADRPRGAGAVCRRGRRHGLRRGRPAATFRRVAPRVGRSDRTRRHAEARRTRPTRPARHDWSRQEKIIASS